MEKEGEKKWLGQSQTPADIVLKGLIKIPTVRS
jgi:hypothetical protein